MPDGSPIQTVDPGVQTPTDPYVIYQLRKPNQRGTAVIPRYVPNTHAPAFSPANYRFARVWPQHDAANAPSSTLHTHAPRSFEYAGSLGSESSVWSDTSSWVSVSSLRTAPSEVRTPLLHQPTAPVSAASFFNNDYNNNPLYQPGRPSSHRSSEHGSSARGSFRYPPALSESISEDAVIDDLLSQRSGQHGRSPTNSSVPVRKDNSPEKRSSRRPSDHGRPRRQSSSHRVSARVTPATHPATRSSFLPALTRKRRSLWQWLFCADHQAHSMTSNVKPITATGNRDKSRSSQSQSQQHSNTVRSTTPAGPRDDRVPNGDKEFLDRGRHARDAADPHTRANKSKRTPSFEIRRGKPNSTWSRRSLSWSLVPRALLGLDKEKDTKKKKPVKDMARGMPRDDEKGDTRANRVNLKKSSSRRNVGHGQDAVKDSRTRGHKTRDHQPGRTKEKSENRGRDEGPLKTDSARKQRSKEARAREERAKRQVDKRHEDRPRENQSDDSRGQTPSVEKRSGGPTQKEFAPSLREKAKTNNVSHVKRMRSSELTDPMSSRINSDLSMRTGSRTGSNSGYSTPTAAHGKVNVPAHDLDPATSGVASDVSSHVSANAAKPSMLPSGPDTKTSGTTHLSSSELLEIEAGTTDPLRSTLFAFPSSSSDSGAFVDAQTHTNETTKWESPTTPLADQNTILRVGGSSSVNRKEGHTRLPDSVARAMEKNRARSTGGPLSYLMKHHETEGEINTGSTGLTSLADESVSTHRSISAVGDEHAYHAQAHGGSRPSHRNGGSGARRTEFVDEVLNVNGSEPRPIFQNSALFAQSRSPRSGAASPRRFHSDWSDPHATDIDVYCQCNCSCVYEEECRRSCELVYGRSPSVSSSRSCGRKGHSGFKSLPPAMDINGVKMRGPQTQVDAMGVAEEELNALMNGGQSSGAHHEVRSKPEKTFIRANAVDELPDVSSGRHSAHSPQSASSAQSQSHPVLRTRLVDGGACNTGRVMPNVDGLKVPQYEERNGRRTDLGRRSASNQFGSAVEERSHARSSTPRPTFVAPHGARNRLNLSGTLLRLDSSEDGEEFQDKRATVRTEGATRGSQRRKSGLGPGQMETGRTRVVPRPAQTNGVAPPEPMVNGHGNQEGWDGGARRSRSGEGKVYSNGAPREPVESRRNTHREHRKSTAAMTRAKSPMGNGTTHGRTGVKEERERHRASRRSVKTTHRSRPALFGMFEKAI